MREAYVPEAWEEVNCMFCQSDRFKPYEKFGDKLQYSYVLCDQCDLVYQSPRPAYNDHFLNSAYGKYFAYDPDYNYSTAELSEASTEIAEILTFDKERTALLDVGSCMGSFIKQALPFYKKVEGVEISEKMASFTESRLGVKVYETQFNNLSSNTKYSCIHMSHVIEHVPNPIEWLEKAKTLLTNNGVLVICVPNMFSLNRKFKRFFQKLKLRSGKWKESWRTPDHLFEPTIPSLKYLFKKQRFKILSYYTYSRKDTTSSRFPRNFMNRTLKIGSNLRFYVTPAE